MSNSDMVTDRRIPFWGVDLPSRSRIVSAMSLHRPIGTGFISGLIVTSHGAWAGRVRGAAASDAKLTTNSEARRLQRCIDVTCLFTVPSASVKPWAIDQQLEKPSDAASNPGRNIGPVSF